MGFRKTPSHSKGKVCAYIYLFEILEETEKMVIKKENGKVIGICGYAKWNSKKHIIRKKFFHILKMILIWSPLVKDKKAIYKYNNDYDYTPEELVNYFDGEISILIQIIVVKGLERKCLHRYLNMLEMIICEIFKFFLTNHAILSFMKLVGAIKFMKNL